MLLCTYENLGYAPMRILVFICKTVHPMLSRLLFRHFLKASDINHSFNLICQLILVLPSPPPLSFHRFSIYKFASFSPIDSNELRSHSNLVFTIFTTRSLYTVYLSPVFLDLKLACMFINVQVLKFHYL